LFYDLFYDLLLVVFSFSFPFYYFFNFYLFLFFYIFFYSYPSYSYTPLPLYSCCLYFRLGTSLLPLLILVILFIHSTKEQASRTKLLGLYYVDATRHASCHSQLPFILYLISPFFCFVSFLFALLLSISPPSLLSLSIPLLVIVIYGSFITLLCHSSRSFLLTLF
jgi:hypothetical protein